MKVKSKKVLVGFVVLLAGFAGFAEEPPEHLYEYRVEYVSAYDADTVRLDVDLGFEVWIQNTSFRLLGIDAPEVRGVERPEGLIARDALRKKLRGAEYLKVRTVKDDKGKYGRWLAVLFVWRDGDWENVNEWLVREGLAVSL